MFTGTVEKEKPGPVMERGKKGNNGKDMGENPKRG